MKYYSEVLNTPFDTEAQLRKEEAEYEKSKKEKEIALTQKQQEISKQKKELSKAIEEADKKVSEANTLLETAKIQATEILEKANKEVKEILDIARKAVKEANEERLNTIIAFNNKFGVYTTTYSGEKAAEEFNRIVNSAYSDIRSLLTRFWY